MNETETRRLSYLEAQQGAPTGGLARAGENAAPASARASIARMRQPTNLAAWSLDAKRLIHEESDDQLATDLFRELRTRVLLDSGMRNPIILISGIKSGCGTSYVARNLASAIAMDPDRTALLIDCNLRRPSQQDAFEAGDGPGLADFLRTPGLTTDRIIYPTGLPRLRIIPAGMASHRHGDHLASLRMRGLIAELSNRYADRCLILDAPPACGTPEARMLAQRADLVLLVAGAAMHSREDVIAAARVFDPARLAGVVYNELP